MFNFWKKQPRDPTNGLPAGSSGAGSGVRSGGLPILQVGPHLFRSPQPDFEDFLLLKRRGVRALVNLREEGTESEFFARQTELLYLHVPVIDWSVPNFEQVRRFLEFVQSNPPVLVHCAAGVGRTGTFVGCYRVSQGMDVETALSLTNQESPIQGVGMNDAQLRFVREFASTCRREGIS